MPRLPDSRDLKQITDINSPRVVIPKSNAGEGLIALGKGLSGLAAGFADMDKLATAEDVSAADADYERRNRDRRHSFDTDTDYETFEPRYREGEQKDIDEISARIRNGRAREMWRNNALQKSSRYFERVHRRGYKLATDKDIVDLEESTKPYMGLATDPDATPDIIEQRIGDMRGQFDAIGMRGRLPQSKLNDLFEKKKDALVSGHLATRLQRISAIEDPAERQKAQREFAQSIGLIRSDEATTSNISEAQATKVSGIVDKWQKTATTRGNWRERNAVSAVDGLSNALGMKREEFLANPAMVAATVGRMIGKTDQQAELEAKSFLDRVDKNGGGIEGVLKTIPQYDELVKGASSGSAKRFRPDVDRAVEAAAARHGMPVDVVRSYVAIESGGNPQTRTGSYKGLLQLSDDEFRKHGGGDIYNIDDNLNAGLRKLKAESDRFSRKYGREPTATDLYLIHQQGEGGYANHMANPDAPAWQNMFRTGEGRAKGQGWAKLAIWGNIPNDMKRRFGSVENVTSRDFIALWDDKVRRFGGQSSKAVSNFAPIDRETVEATVSKLGFISPFKIDETDADSGGSMSPTEERAASKPDDEFFSVQPRSGLLANLSPRAYRALTHNMRQVLSAELQASIRDENAMIEAGRGDEIKTNTLEQAKNFVPRSVLIRLESQRKVSETIGRLNKEFPTLSNAQGDGELRALLQDTPAKDFEEARKAHQKLASKWEKVKELRRKDPGEAVESHPVVQAYRDEVSQSGIAGLQMSEDGSLKPSSTYYFDENGTPRFNTSAADFDVSRAQEFAAGYAAAKLRAQEELGILSPKAISKAQAIRLLGMDRTPDDTAMLQDSLKAAAQRALTVYGEDMGKRVFKDAVALVITQGGSEGREARANAEDDISRAAREYEASLLAKFSMPGEKVRLRDIRSSEGLSNLSATTGWMGMESPTDGPAIMESARPISPSPQHIQALKNVLETSSPENRMKAIAAFNAKFGSDAASAVMSKGQ